MPIPGDRGACPGSKYGREWIDGSDLEGERVELFGGSAADGFPLFGVGGAGPAW